MNKQRGRPPGSKSPMQADTSQVPHEKSRSESRNPSRAPRVPMVAGKNLELPIRKGYHRHWFINKPGRIEQAENAYWGFIFDDTGSKITRPSGPFLMFAMEIEDRYWKEDNDLKNKKTIDTLRAEQELSVDEYVPEGRSHVLEKDNYDPLS